jgi:hypothetical protein
MHTPSFAHIPKCITNASSIAHAFGLWRGPRREPCRKRAIREHMTANEVSTEAVLMPQLVELADELDCSVSHAVTHALTWKLVVPVPKRRTKASAGLVAIDARQSTRPPIRDSRLLVCSRHAGHNGNPALAIGRPTCVCSSLWGSSQPQSGWLRSRASALRRLEIKRPRADRRLGDLVGLLVVSWEPSTHWGRKSSARSDQCATPPARRGDRSRRRHLGQHAPHPRVGIERRRRTAPAARESADGIAPTH